MYIATKLNVQLIGYPLTSLENSVLGNKINIGLSVNRLTVKSSETDFNNSKDILYSVILAVLGCFAVDKKIEVPKLSGTPVNQFLSLTR